MDISIAIVSYNSCEILCNCIRSISDITHGCTYEIIIVDNASSDDSVESIKKEFPSVHLIENKENVGFSKAVNQAFNVSSGEFFFLLNPDARLISNILPGMVDFFHDHPRAGIVAPKIVFPDNRLHPSARRFITLPGAIFDVLQIHFYFPRNKIAKKFDYDKWKHDKIREVDWVTGAAFMTRSETFASCGMLDERYFMYFEDMDYCVSVKEIGYKTYFCPTFSVLHHHAKGGSDKLPVRSVDYYISLFHYLLKYQGIINAGLFRVAMISWGFIYMLKKTVTYFTSQKPSSLREDIDIPLRLILFKSYAT